MFNGILLVFGVLLLLSSGSCFKIQPRIVNGLPIELGQFPYFALLEIKARFHPKGQTVCGGSLLNEEFVLTAAHCVENATKVLVHLGALRREAHEEGRHVFFARRKHLYIHPDWNAEEVIFDIALIKLPRRAIYSDLIQPVPLPKFCDLPSGKQLIAVGTGYNETNGDFTDTLHYTRLITIPFSKCDDFYGLHEGSPIFCAEGIVNNSICDGDSGGPLVDPVDNTIYGVTSFRDGSGCNGMPQGFTSVSMFLPWISEITGIDVFVDCFDDDHF